MAARSSTWRVTFLAPEHAVPAYELALDPYCSAFSWSPLDPDVEPGAGGMMRVLAIAAKPLPRPAIVAALAVAAALSRIEPAVLEFDRLPDVDWLTQSLRSFPPIDAGRFHLRGSHIHAPRPAGRITLIVDAGAAFGSGEHASTKGCLLAFDRLLKRRRFFNVLDMGCGSGVLGMAAAKAQPLRVLATDIDERAASIASANARKNGVAARMRAAASDGYKSRLIKSRAPYDLVFANILARPLARMAAPLARHLAPNGVVILAGLLRRQERLVLAAHRAHGLALIERVRLGDWTTLVVGRR